MTEPSAFEDWAILELMGHRVLAGYVTEAELAGAAFLRLDIPGGDGRPPVTQYYSPGALYALTPTTEEIATRIARGRRPQPVNRWELEPPRTPADDATADVDGDAWEGGPC